MQGVVALFAFIDQFILQKPLVWVKTPRSRLDQQAGDPGRTGIPGRSNDLISVPGKKERGVCPADRQ
jgi:hypothetical protein